MIVVCQSTNCCVPVYKLLCASLQIVVCQSTSCCVPVYKFLCASLQIVVCQSTNCCVSVYKLSLLSRPRAQELYRTESLHPPGYPVTAGVQDSFKEISCISCRYLCSWRTFSGTRAVSVGTQGANEPLISVNSTDSKRSWFNIWYYTGCSSEVLK